MGARRRKRHQSKVRYEKALRDLSRITGLSRRVVEYLSGCCNCPAWVHLRWNREKIITEYARRWELFQVPAWLHSPRWRW